MQFDKLAVNCTKLIYGILGYEVTDLACSATLGILYVNIGPIYKLTTTPVIQIYASDECGNTSIDVCLTSHSPRYGGETAELSGMQFNGLVTLAILFSFRQTSCKTFYF